MGRLKSVLPKLEIETAQRSHDCRHNKAHRINKGENRLLVQEGRNRYTYCLDCAGRIVDRVIERLQQLATKTLET